LDESTSRISKVGSDTLELEFCGNIKYGQSQLLNGTGNSIRQKVKARHGQATARKITTEQNKILRKRKKKKNQISKLSTVSEKKQSIQGRFERASQTPASKFSFSISLPFAVQTWWASGAAGSSTNWPAERTPGGVCKGGTTLVELTISTIVQ